MPHIELTPTGVSTESVGTANLANGSVTTEKLANNAVTHAKIALETINAETIASAAVTEPKLAAKSVGAVKTVQATVPVPSATENTKVVGAGGVARTLLVAYTGNGVETKVAIKHAFEKQGVLAFAMKSATKLPTELPTTALGKWVNETSEEGTYTFTAAPALKEEVFILVIG